MTGTKSLIINQQRKTAKNKKENRKTREMLDGREKEPYTKK